MDEKGYDILLALVIPASKILALKHINPVDPRL